MKNNRMYGYGCTLLIIVRSFASCWNSHVLIPYMIGVRKNSSTTTIPCAGHGEILEIEPEGDGT